MIRGPWGEARSQITRAKMNRTRSTYELINALNRIRRQHVHVAVGGDCSGVLLGCRGTLPVRQHPAVDARPVSVDERGSCSPPWRGYGLYRNDHVRVAYLVFRPREQSAQSDGWT